MLSANAFAGEQDRLVALSAHDCTHVCIRIYVCVCLAAVAQDSFRQKRSSTKVFMDSPEQQQLKKKKGAFKATALTLVAEVNSANMLSMYRHVRMLLAAFFTFFFLFTFAWRLS